MVYLWYIWYKIDVTTLYMTNVTFYSNKKVIFDTGNNWVQATTNFLY